MVGMSQVQTYLTWDSPLGNYIQINSNQGIQRNAGNTFGYDQGDVESVQTISSGESVTFQIGAPGSQFYIGLISSKPKGQIVADNNEDGTWVGSDATVKFGQVFGVFGNDSTSAFEDGITKGTKYRATINQWFRINYTGSSIQYQYSTDNAATFNTFYTSTNTASGSYYVYFSAFILNVSLQSIYKTGAGGGNQAPTVSATASNSTVTSPVTTNTLTASASDPDGSISSYSWVKISGPTGGSITSPTASSTGITGLTNAGTYVYRVTVTDNGGATATADVAFLVTGATQQLVNAGPDQALPIGTTSTTLSGTAVTASQTDLIIFFGESNASGQAPNTSATSIERLPRSSVKIYNNFNGLIENLDLDQNNNLDVCGIPSTHGWEIGLADAVEAGRLNNPTYLLKVACAGTRIDQWLNGSGNPSWNEFVRKVDDMLAKMSAQGVVSPNITMWMSIGLNDALQGTSTDSFSARINRFTAAVRAKYGSGIRVYMTQFHRYRADFGETAPSANGHPYNAVIDAIDAGDPLLSIVETSDARWIGYGVDDPVHWDYSGMKLIADRMVTGTINNRPGSTVTWTKESGPSGGTIASPNQLVTTVSGLNSGNYVYRLTSGSQFDEVTIAVGQSSSNIVTTIIPESDPEIMRHLGGAEDWFGQNTVALPTNANKQLPRSTYKRFNWYELETAQGVFNWPEFDQFFIDAINNGQTVSWGVMTMNENTGAGRPFVGGAWLNYPVYLHNLMQAEAVNSRPWQYTSGSTNFWVPNWNSPNFLARTKALYDSLYNRMNTRTHNGILFKNIVDVVEVRHYGQWGEWHAVNYASQPTDYPTGRQPTVATLDSIISYIVKGNPDLKTTIIISAFDAYRLSNVWNDPAVARFALTIQNQAGFVGWRKDHWGDADLSSTYDYNWTNLNDRGYTAPTVSNQQPGGSFVAFGIDTATMNRWKLAPITGEPPGYRTEDTRGDMANLPKEVRFWRAASFGNGNMSQSYGLPQPWGFAEDSVRLASKIAGHRLQIEGGTMTQTLVTGASFSITLNWRNAGLTPTYDKYDVMLELRNGSGQTVWSDTSSFQPYLFLPASTATPITDNFTLTSIPVGVYNLFIRIVDKKGYRTPLPLAIQGRTGDGSYQIRSGVQVAAGGTNQAPTVAISGTATVTLPATSTSLTASATDPDGTISSYSWTQVSGPNTATIGSPSAATTTLTGLVQGSYNFQVLVTDNGGLTATANRVVTVLPAATVNAGRDKTVYVNKVVLQGTYPANTSSVAWTKISGPVAGTIVDPASAKTDVTGLTPGTYVFRLTATVGGQSFTDDITITVSNSRNRRVRSINVQ